MSVLALSETYNAFHLVDQSQEKRTALYEKRLTEGLLLYEILEFTHRYDLTINHVRGDIDKTILDNFEELKAKFERTWGKHYCEEEGCGRVLTLDGNLKLTRRMCAAKTAGVKKFDHSSGYVLTGCCETPPIGKKFCSLHAEGNTPSIPAEKPLW